MNFVNRIRGRLFWVLLLTIVGLGGGVAYSFVTTTGYNATTRLFVSSTARDAIEAAQGNVAGQERLKTYAVLGIGSDLLDRAADRSQTDVTGADLRSRLTIVPIPGTLLLEIRVKDENPGRAASEADAVATELINLVRKVEAPINGGDAALGLITVQAHSDVVPASKFDYKKIAAGGGIGLVLGLILTGTIPERRPHTGRRRRGYKAKQADQRHDDDMLQPETLVRQQ